MRYFLTWHLLAQGLLQVALYCFAHLPVFFPFFREEEEPETQSLRQLYFGCVHYILNMGI